MTGQQQYSLKWNDYTSYITGAFDALRYEEDLVDVTLFCEGRKIRAHKVLLSACSSYFKDIFKENPCQHPVIIFKNVKYNDLLSLVEFMYQGEVSVSQESLPSFLHTAELLSIRGLADTNGGDQQHNNVVDHPTSSLAQQILQTQSQSLANSATITTAEPVYFTLPSSSTIVPQIKVEPQQPSTSIHTAQQFINKITLKSADLLTNAIAVPVAQQGLQVQHAQQSQQPTQQQQVVQQHQTAKIHIKQLQPATSAVVQRTAIQSQTVQNQANQSSNALQELVDSVVSTARRAKPKRIIKPKQTLPTTSKQAVEENTTNVKTTTNYTALDASDQNDNGMEIYESTQEEHEQVTSYGDVANSENNEVKIQISEFISVGETINPTSGDSGTYPQQEGYELVSENITERQDSDEHMGQNSFEMEIVDMDVNGIFPDEAQEATSKADILETAIRVKEDKRFKCRECEKSFATWKSLAMHRHIHSGRTQCTICGAVLSRTANLKRHMKLKHEP